MRKVIVTVAPVGSIPTREDSPHIPITPEEIGAEARRSVEAGAAVVHLHVRDQKTGAPTADPDTFRACLDAVRAETDAVTQITTGGGATTLGLSPAERLQAVLQSGPGRRRQANPVAHVQFVLLIAASTRSPEFDRHRRRTAGPGGEPRSEDRATEQQEGLLLFTEAPHLQRQAARRATCSARPLDPTRHGDQCLKAVRHHALLLLTCEALSSWLPPAGRSRRGGGARRSRRRCAR